MALSDNLVFYSDMTDATSTTVTENTGSYTLTKLSSGNPSQATGKIGNGQTFSSDYITTTFSPNAVIGSSDYTIAFWFNVASLDSRRTMLCFDEGSFSQYVDIRAGRDSDGNDIRVTFEDGSASSASLSATGYQDGLWHLLVLTRVGSTGTLYIDNTLAQTTSNSHIADSLADDMHIGAFNGSSLVNQMTGSLDEIGIWTTALGSVDRSDLWNGSDGRDYTYISGGGTPSAILPQFSGFARL